jgi:hypothetical protein
LERRETKRANTSKCPGDETRREMIEGDIVGPVEMVDHLLSFM